MLILFLFTGEMYCVEILIGLSVSLVVMYLGEIVVVYIFEDKIIRILVLLLKSVLKQLDLIHILFQLHFTIQNL